MNNTKFHSTGSKCRLEGRSATAGSQAEGDQEKGPGVNETHKRKHKPQTDSASEKGDQWEGEKWVLFVF